MADVIQNQVLRLSGRIGKLEESIVKNAGVLSVDLCAPQSFANNTPAAVGFSAKVIESGIITGDTQTGMFTVSEDCAVLIAYQQEIAHSNIEDEYHLDLYGNGVSAGRIASYKIPAGTTATAVFAASANLAAGVNYSLMIRANGISGTHVPQYQNACNRLSIMVTGCSGLVGPQGRKGDKGDKGDTGAGAPYVIVNYSADGSNWHSVYAPGDDYIRFSTDGGGEWGGAVYVRGRQGLQGIQGMPGEGVPGGGAAGQILAKKTNADYDTAWADAAPVVAPAVDNTNDSSENETIKVWEGTQAAYDALGTHNEDTLFIISDEQTTPTVPFTLDSMPVGFNMPWWSDNLPSSKYMFMEGQSLAGYPYAQAVFGDMLPDLRGRVMVHKSMDSEFNTLKKSGGEKTHLLTSAESGLPDHLHKLSTAWDMGSGGAQRIDWGTAYAGAATGGVNGGAVNASSAHNNLQPYIVCRYIAKVIP